MTKQVHFSLGSDTGRLLAEVAREHLLYKGDLSGSVEDITRSLIGCPEDTAFKIITGEYALEVHGGEMEIVQGEKFDFEEFFENRLGTIAADAGEWRRALKELLQQLRNSETLSFEVPVHLFAQYLWEREDDLLDAAYENSRETDGISIVTFREFLEGLKNLFDRWYNAQKLIRHIREKDPALIPEGFEIAPPALVQLQCEMRELFVGPTCRDNDELDKLVQSIRSEAEECDVFDCDITDSYDAGWIAPNGTFYGEYGSISQMIHIDIAEKLYHAGLIPSDSVFESDIWMMEHGWCKVHGNHVLFDGYVQARYGAPLVRLTEEQREALIKYGDACHNGFLSFGIQHRIKSTAFLRSVEPLMLGKLFDQDL